MSAKLIALSDAPTVKPSARAERLDTNWRDAEQAVNTALFEAGLLDRPGISPGAPKEHLVGMHGLRCREWEAQWRLVSFWERQTAKYQTMLRRVLASDTLDEDQRQAVITGLHGPRGIRLDTKTLSESEYRLIAQYRRMDDRDRQMIRTLIDRLERLAEHRKDEQSVPTDRTGIAEPFA